MSTSMRGPYTGPRGGVYYIDANGNKQYGEPPTPKARTSLGAINKKIRAKVPASVFRNARNPKYGLGGPTTHELSPFAVKHTSWSDPKNGGFDISKWSEARKRKLEAFRKKPGWANRSLYAATVRFAANERFQYTEKLRRRFSAIGKKSPL